MKLSGIGFIKMYNSQLPSPLRSPMDIHSSLTYSPSASMGFPIFHQDYATKGQRSIAPQKTKIRLGEAAISRNKIRTIDTHPTWPTPFASSSSWMNNDNSAAMPMTDFLNPAIPILDHTTSSPSASYTSSNNAAVIKFSKKKQMVDPLSYNFTSESALVTDPVKFDEAVIAFLKDQGTPVIKMPSVDKKWLSFWSLFHGIILLVLCFSCS